MTSEDLKLLWSMTHTGRKFYYYDVRPDQIDIEDIAHSLGNQCRFNGHTNQFYSVAEHSVLGSYLVPEDQALEFLLHDASEAYISDIPKPFKVSIANVIDPCESRYLEVIFEKYGATFPLTKEIKVVDFEMLYWERNLLLPPEPKWGIFEGVSLPEERRPDIQGLPPAQAKEAFLQRFEELTR